MSEVVDPVPEGFNTVTPYLMVSDADAMVRFMEETFGAEENFRANGAAGGLHVEVRVGDSMVMLGGMPGRETVPTTLFVYMESVDEVYERALAAGATSIEEPKDNPQDADRRAGIVDPLGNTWFIATNTEDVSREELKERVRETPESR